MRIGQLSDAMIDSLVTIDKIGRSIKFGLTAAKRLNCLSVWLRPWKSFKNVFTLEDGMFSLGYYLAILRDECGEIWQTGYESFRRGY